MTRSLTMACVAASLCTAGCKDDPPVATQYAYRVNLKTVDGSPLSDAQTVLVFGEEVSAKGPTVTLDAATWLSASGEGVEAEYATTCGRLSIGFASEGDRDQEEVLRAGSLKHRSPVAWNMVALTPLPDQWATVYVDNSNGESAVTFRLGTRVFEVDAKSHRSVNTRLGTCPEARQVTVGDVLVGQLTSKPGLASLVNINGDGCYVVRTTLYSANPEGAGQAPEDSVIKMPPGQHVLEVSRVDSLFGAVPDTVSVRVAPGGEAYSSAARSSLHRCQVLAAER